MMTLRRSTAWLLLIAAGATAADFPQGLTLHFGFDAAAASGSVPDKSGRGNDGRIRGAKWTSLGKLGGAADFAATNNCILVPPSPSLNATQVTLSVWFKTSQTGAVERGLIDRQPAAGYTLAIANGRLRFTVNGHDCVSDNSLADGAWHHTAGTYDGLRLKLYVDGQVQKKVTEFAGSIAAGTNDVCIGMSRSDAGAQAKGASFDGVLDEVMIFDRAITAEQVQAVMAAAKAKFSEAEVKRRLGELKELLDRGLILPEFYERKVKECEPSP